ncbi:MAG: tetratricopeptide repeat protein [Deltaproteobacteria bacterium]|nr:tetratricopeptide repeat protein [Deltaproteobacteria bacterium]MBW2073889.1 tetratricopeptide repeat protein [Deltaproteobacteria bacterium]
MARETFKRAMEAFPFSPVIDQTAFHYAITYFKEEKWQQALEAFEQMATDYPETRKLPEVLYHMGLCHLKLHQPDEAVTVFNRILERFPDERWAGYAKKRIEEMSNRGSANCTYLEDSYVEAL